MTASAQKHAGDRDRLYQAMMGFAMEMLDKHGEFFPFGAVVTTDGELQLSASTTGEEHPDSNELITLLVRGHLARASNGTIRASAIAADVRMREAEDATVVDAVQVTVEHRSAAPLIILVPYRLIGGEAEFDEPVYRTDSARVFSDAAPG